MSFETLEVTVEGVVGTIQLARPEQRNAISRRMLIELAEAAGEMDESQDVRVVILDGAGPAFCAGVDLEDFESFLGKPGSMAGLMEGTGKALTMAALGRAASVALSSMKHLTIAKIKGYAIGGGAVVALAADLRVMSEEAFLWIPEVELGTPLVWGAIPKLVAEIGPARTKDIVTTCRRLPAREALEMGLVSRVVPADQLDGTVDQLAEDVAARPRYPVEATKSHVNAVARAMVMGDTSYADGYLQAASWLDPEVRRKAADYVAGLRSTTRR